MPLTAPEIQAVWKLLKENGLYLPPDDSNGADKKQHEMELPVFNDQDAED